MAARQLASRARRRVLGAPATPEAELSGQRTLIAKFLAAVRAGDVSALVAVLDPELVVRIDEASALPDGQREVRGAEVWARQAIAVSRGARFVQPVLVDGVPGVVLAPHGRLMRVLRFTFAEDRIVSIDIVGDPEDLGRMDLAVLGE
jgi:RNA polymerase sigma-70 factor (ECF subfamily)